MDYEHFIFSEQGYILSAPLSLLFTWSPGLKYPELATITFLFPTHPLHLHCVEGSLYVQSALKGGYLRKLFGVLLQKDLLILHHLFIQSFIYINMDSRPFMFQVIIQYYFVDFVAQIFPTLATESSFSGLSCLLDIPQSPWALIFSIF